jgi:outer membrane protein OmpA-like peptidoglycan-associated protein
MKKGVLFLLGLIGLALLAFFCIRWNGASIEKDIASRTQLALKGAGLDFAQVRVDGRDVYLAGTAPSREALERSIDLAEGLEGVRRVASSLVVAKAPEPPPPVVQAPQPATAPAPTAFSFTFDSEGDFLKLTGLLPDAATRERFLQATGSRAAGKRIDQRLELETAAPEPWKLVLEALLRYWDDVVRVSARLEDNRLSIAGVMKSEKVRDQFVQFLKMSLPAATASEVAIEVPALTPAAAACQKDIDGLIAKAQIRFAVASAALDSAASGALLKELAGIAGRCPKVKITIAGHTDSNGGAEFNMNLSRERAQAVARQLIDMGVDRQRITTVGYGETRPIADNATETGRALNRRIEFVITEE